MKDEVLKHYEKIAPEFTDLSNPYCNSRYKQVLDTIIKPSDSVLEVGCGTGLLLSKIKARKKVGCDFSGALLAQAKGGDATLVKADAESLPFPDGMFDVVYSVNLLEHVPHPDVAISEATRVLKSGGTLVAITPNGDIGLLLEIADILKLKAPEGPHSFLSSDRLIDIFKDNHLRIARAGKLVLIPSGPGFIKRIGERFESIIPFVGFFHIIIAQKNK